MKIVRVPSAPQAALDETLAVQADAARKQQTVESLERCVASLARPGSEIGVAASAISGLCALKLSGAYTPGQALAIEAARIALIAATRRRHTEATREEFRLLFSAVAELDAYARHHLPLAAFADRSNAPDRPSDYIARMPWHRAVRDLDNARSILAYADGAAARGEATLELVRVLRRAMSQPEDGSPSIVPGTETAWALALEKLTRCINPVAVGEERNTE